jgi:hypothetical protein
MLNTIIDIFEMSYEESVSYFKRLENLEKIRCTNGPSPPSSVVKSPENRKASNMWCHYCDKNNHNTADCRAIAKFKHQKKACIEAKAGPRKKSLAFSFLFKEINAIKWQFNPVKTSIIKKR